MDLKSTKNRLNAPPATDAPTKEKALNLPEDPDEDVEGIPTGELLVAPEELEGTKDGTSDKDAENSEDRPIQASSSSVRRAAGGIEDDIMITGSEIENTNRS